MHGAVDDERVPTDDGHRALAVISGDFPGSPVTLAVTFTFAAGRIRTLTIRPAED